MATNSNPNYSFHIHSGVMLTANQTTYEAGSIVFEEQIGALSVVITKGSSLLRIADGIKGLTINKSGDVPTSVVFTLLGGTTQTLDLSKFQTATQVSSAITTALAAYVKTTDFNTYKEGILSEMNDIRDAVADNTNEISSLGGRMDDAEGEIDNLSGALNNVYTKSEVYTKGETDKQIGDKIAALGKVFEFKGTKETYADLPTTGNENGDVWQVTTAGTITSSGAKFEANTEFYWDGTKWEILGVNQVNMDNYYTKGEADGKFATSDDLAEVDDKVSVKLEKEGTRTADEVLVWGSGDTKVKGSGKKISTSVNDNANEIPTSKAVYGELADKMPKVESGVQGEILVRDANGNAENSGVTIGQDMIGDDESDLTIPTAKDVGDYVKNMLKWSTWPAN